MSFQNPYSGPRPGIFDRSFRSFSDPIIAPYWTNIPPFAIFDVFYRSTINAAILDNVAEMIAGVNSNYRDFQPKVAAIVTWEFIFAEVCMHCCLNTYYTIMLCTFIIVSFLVDSSNSANNRWKEVVCNLHI